MLFIPSGSTAKSYKAASPESKTMYLCVAVSTPRPWASRIMGPESKPCSAPIISTGNSIGCPSCNITLKNGCSGSANSAAGTSAGVASRANGATGAAVGGAAGAGAGAGTPPGGAGAAGGAGAGAAGGAGAGAAGGAGAGAPPGGAGAAGGAGGVGGWPSLMSFYAG